MSDEDTAFIFEQHGRNIRASMPPQPPHVGERCPKAPHDSVHIFCFAGPITTSWEDHATCKWCGITPNGKKAV